MYTAYLQSVTAVSFTQITELEIQYHFSMTRNMDSYLKVYIMINIVQFNQSSEEVVMFSLNLIHYVPSLVINKHTNMLHIYFKCKLFLYEMLILALTAPPSQKIDRGTSLHYLLSINFKSVFLKHFFKACSKVNLKQKFKQTGEDTNFYV